MESLRDQGVERPKFYERHLTMDLGVMEANLI
jgi:putative heme degradation protein